MQAETGLMHLTGEPDSPPTRIGAPSMVDHVTGLTAMVGLLSALISARATGKGCDVDTCLFDAALHQLGYAAIWYLNERHVPARQTRSAHFSLAPVQTLPTADGWVFVMCLTEKFWSALLDVIGRPTSRPTRASTPPRRATRTASRSRPPSTRRSASSPPRTG
jgi:crotonobetainyl-CoA:carnitine CoA-transferase CaiB-like acyl-CoA transferase